MDVQTIDQNNKVAAEAIIAGIWSSSILDHWCGVEMSQLSEFLTMMFISALYVYIRDFTIFEREIVLPLYRIMKRLDIFTSKRKS